MRIAHRVIVVASGPGASRQLEEYTRAAKYKAKADFAAGIALPNGLEGDSVQLVLSEDRWVDSKQERERSQRFFAALKSTIENGPGD